MPVIVLDKSADTLLLSANNYPLKMQAYSLFVPDDYGTKMTGVFKVYGCIAELHPEYLYLYFGGEQLKNLDKIRPGSVFLPATTMLKARVNGCMKF